MLLPDVMLNRITDIDLPLLQSLGVRGLILDVDNTLAVTHSEIPLSGLEDWLAQMRLGGVKMVIVSNNSKERVGSFAARLGLPFVSFAMKPLGFGYLRGIAALGVKRREAAVVGDQIFTDVLGAKALGVKTVLVSPIEPETKFSFKVRRHFERGIIEKYRRLHSDDAREHGGKRDG